MKRTQSTILHTVAGLAILAALTIGCTPPLSESAKKTLAAICDMYIINVTKTADTNDGWCDGLDCSLREAVIESNFCPGDQTINVPPGTYNLTLAGAGEDMAATGDLDITANVTILGTDHPVVDGNGLDRVFEVFSGATAGISGMVIQNGEADLGGGLRNRGILNVNESTVQNNSATADGGGIYSQGNGSLGVYLSDVQGNSAIRGGGILVQTGAGVSQTVMVSYSNVSDNTAASDGGGIWLDSGAVATIIRFEGQGNASGGNGNGIFNAGNLELNTATLEENEGGVYGGGIYNDSTGTVISRSLLLQSNQVSGGGGGIYNRGMAHFYQSAIIYNEATNGQGGGAYNGSGASLLINNTTISANIGIFGGGGIRNEDGNFQLMFVTIYSNENEGINSSGSGETTMRNTILSTNMDGNCAGTPPNSIGHNIDSGNSCALIEPSDLPNTDPMLDPLAMDGSVLPTNALQLGSPAIDSADPDRCSGSDQRGVTRPQGANCDRGAYEREPVAEGRGTISGRVWHDLCALPDGPMPPSPPSGCIPFGDSYEANGVLDPGEPGIAGVSVLLVQGPCGSAPYSVVTTAGDGTFSFTGLSAGPYCVSVNELEEPNVSVLIPGGWTYPVRGAHPAQTEITLGDGEARADMNFGWDYQFLPAWTGPTPTPTPTLTPVITLTPTLTPAGLAFGKPWFDPDHFYYYGSRCGPKQVKLQISISNPGLVKSMGLFIRLKDKASDAKTGWSEGLAMTPLGGGNYIYTLLSESIPDYSSFAEAWLQYQFSANKEDYIPLLHSEVYSNITLSRCGKQGEK